MEEPAALAAELEHSSSDALIGGRGPAPNRSLGTGLRWDSRARGLDRLALPRTATVKVPASSLVALIDKRLGA